MRGNGITYDTGFINAGVSTREPFDPDIVKREMRVIREHLHCNEVRITHGDRDRQEIAPPAPPTPVDEQLQDDARPDLAGGVRVVFTPGHICLYLDWFYERVSNDDGGDAAGLLCANCVARYQQCWAS